MKKHIQTVHDGVKYPCDQCEKQFTQQSNLNKHILSPHEGIKYPCGQCTKQFTELGSLKKHMKAIHLKVKYYWSVLLSFKRYIVIFRMSRILCRTPSFDWLWQAQRSVFFFIPNEVLRLLLLVVLQPLVTTEWEIINQENRAIS